MKQINLTKTFLLSLISLSILTTSCRKITCEAYNLDHETMNWHFFPELKEEYIFQDADSNEITFTLTQFSQSPYEERYCHYCACFPTLESSYESSTNGLVLANIAFYETIWGSTQSSIQYNVDERKANMDVIDGGLVEYADSVGYKNQYSIQNFDSLDLRGNTFYEVIEFEIVDATRSKIERFWFQKSQGIIGFRLQNKLWLKQE